MGTRAIQTLLLLLPLLAACSGHGTLSEEPDVAQADSLVTLTFRFTIPYTLVPETRNEWTDASGTTWNDGDSEATKWENYIDIPNNDFRFYIIGAAHKHFVSLSPLTDRTDGVVNVVLDHLKSPTSYIYELRTKVTKSVVEKITSNPFRMIMEANWYHGNLKDDNLTYDDSRNSSFTKYSGTYRIFQEGYPTYPEDENINHNDILDKATFYWNHQPISDRHTIPMYGAVSANGKVTYTEGGMFWFDTLYLIRALAKIEVCLSEDVAKMCTIKSCSLINYNTIGYYTPKIKGYSGNWLPLNDTKTLYYKYDGGDLHANNDAVEKTKPASFDTSLGTKAVIYTPEINAANIEIAIRNLTLEKKEGGFLTFWDEGMRISEIGFTELKRNNIYRIVITSIDTQPQYTVCHWHYETAGDITFN